MGSGAGTGDSERRRSRLEGIFNIPSLKSETVDSVNGFITQSIWSISQSPSRSRARPHLSYPLREVSSFKGRALRSDHGNLPSRRYAKHSRACNLRHWKAAAVRCRRAPAVSSTESAIALLRKPPASRSLVIYCPRQSQALSRTRDRTEPRVQAPAGPRNFFLRRINLRPVSLRVSAFTGRAARNKNKARKRAFFLHGRTSLPLKSPCSGQFASMSRSPLLP
jgi:hypothetical protein